MKTKIKTEIVAHGMGASPETLIEVNDASATADIVGALQQRLYRIYRSRALSAIIRHKAGWFTVNLDSPKKAQRGGNPFIRYATSKTWKLAKLRKRDILRYIASVDSQSDLTREPGASDKSDESVRSNTARILVTGETGAIRV